MSKLQKFEIGLVMEEKEEKYMYTYATSQPWKVFAQKITERFERGVAQNSNRDVALKIVYRG
jgi:hypothetical protein